MIIHSRVTEEIATEHNSDAADWVVYVPVDINGKANVNNCASLCIWIVPGTITA